MRTEAVIVHSQAEAVVQYDAVRLARAAERPLAGQASVRKPMVLLRSRTFCLCHGHPQERTVKLYRLYQGALPLEHLVAGNPSISV